MAESIAVKRMASASLAVALVFGAALAQVSDPDAVRQRALALARAGEYAQARADLERLVSERPDDRLARKLLVRVLIAAGATSDAASHLERLVRTDGTDAEAWSLLGRLHQDAQRFSVAARALERAVGLDGSDVAAQRKNRSGGRFMAPAAAGTRGRSRSRTAQEMTSSKDRRPASRRRRG
ncbi:MAG: tetratricopeptide repeat protein [Vicinamibacterales bacterium]